MIKLAIYGNLYQHMPPDIDKNFEELENKIKELEIKISSLKHRLDTHLYRNMDE